MWCYESARWPAVISPGSRRLARRKRRVKGRAVWTPTAGALNPSTRSSTRRIRTRVVALVVAAAPLGPGTAIVRPLDTEDLTALRIVVPSYAAALQQVARTTAHEDSLALPPGQRDSVGAWPASTPRRGKRAAQCWPGAPVTRMLPIIPSAK